MFVRSTITITIPRTTQETSFLKEISIFQNCIHTLLPTIDMFCKKRQDKKDPELREQTQNEHNKLQLVV